MTHQHISTVFKLHICLYLLLLFAVTSCKQSNPNSYEPGSYLSPDKQTRFLYSISRYTAKLPERVGHEQKFDSSYNRYYQEEMKKYQLKHYYISPESTHYFLINRIAPSLYGKKVAIGGYLQYDTHGKISQYVEVFRTWKMKEEELKRKGEVLFTSMIEKGNVDQYLPQNTQEDWVEFPDARNYYDKDSRRWKSVGQTDSLPAADQ